MSKKYDDNSKVFADWTIKKLKSEAISYDELINRVSCYGVKDIMALEGILDELDNREEIREEIINNGEVVNYDIADSIIENIIDPLLEYTIDGRLYSNLQQQIVELLAESNKE